MSAGLATTYFLAPPVQIPGYSCKKNLRLSAFNLLDWTFLSTFAADHGSKLYRSWWKIIASLEPLKIISVHNNGLMMLISSIQSCYALSPSKQKDCKNSHFAITLKNRLSPLLITYKTMMKNWLRFLAFILLILEVLVALSLQLQHKQLVLVSSWKLLNSATRLILHCSRISLFGVPLLRQYLCEKRI